MALQWNYNKKSGTITEIDYGNEITLDFYEGNAFMIALDSDRNLHWFFVGADHAKNCLGLTKGHSNMFGENGITCMTIYRDCCKQWPKIAELFTKAFPGITVNLVEKAP